MSSKEGRSGSKKRGRARKHRQRQKRHPHKTGKQDQFRRRNLWRKIYLRHEKLISRSTHIENYKKEQIPTGREFYIKDYLNLLKKDIKLYKEFKEKYTKGNLVDNVMDQINKDCSMIEEKLLEPNLPEEKLTELKREYETIKSELNYS